MHAKEADKCIGRPIAGQEQLIVSHAHDAHGNDHNGDCPGLLVSIGDICRKWRRSHLYYGSILEGAADSTTQPPMCLRTSPIYQR